jgi:hypothetical protein
MAQPIVAAPATGAELLYRVVGRRSLDRRLSGPSRCPVGARCHPTCRGYFVYDDAGQPAGDFVSGAELLAGRGAAA